MKDNKTDFSERQPFAADFISGGAAGFISGGIIAPVEFSKVMLQTTPRAKWTAVLRSADTYKNASKAVLPFSVIFSSVCALEFSVNRRIGHKYGEAAGIYASALTGAFFLTAADHLMFRRHMGEETTNSLHKLFTIRANALWTGFAPMIGREAIFVSSVMHLGPALGSRLNSDTENKSLFWSSVGRLVTGVTTTILSQPFDVMARKMQVELYNNPNKKPSLLHCYKNIQAEYKNEVDRGFLSKHPLFRGALPRMGLATVGGILAGGFFDAIRSNLDDFVNAKVIENVNPIVSTAYLERYNRPRGPSN